MKTTHVARYPFSVVILDELNPVPWYVLPDPEPTTESTLPVTTKASKPWRPASWRSLATTLGSSCKL